MLYRFMNKYNENRIWEAAGQVHPEWEPPSLRRNLCAGEGRLEGS